MGTSALAAAMAPTQQQLVDYMNAAAKVNLYAFAITQTMPPVLSNPPEDYAQFANSFGSAKSHVMTWTTSIFPTILTIPGNLAGLTNRMFSMEENVAGLALAILIKNPGNEEAKADLKEALSGMQQIIQGEITTTTSLLCSFRKFSSDIDSDATTLTTIAAQALSMAGEERTKIDTLSAMIDDLNNKIATYQTWLTVSRIGLGVSLFVAVIGVACCFIPGAQGAGVGLIVIGAIGEGSAIAGTVIFDTMIQADQTLITAHQDQIKDEQQDIVLLQAANKQLVWLHDANIAAQAAMGTVIDMWTQLDNELETAKHDLTVVGCDVSGAQYSKALADLKIADAAWQEVVTFAEALAGVDYKWQDQQGNWHSFADPSNPVTADGALVTPIPQTQAA